MAAPLAPKWPINRTVHRQAPGYNVAMLRFLLPRALTWYVLRQLVTVTTFVFLSLTAAIWLTQSLRFIELVVNRGLSLDAFLYLTLLLLPSFVSILLPISLFTAVLFTYNRLSSDSELVVMRAAGMAPLQLAQAALLFAGFAVALGYLVSLYLLPVSQRAFTDMRSSALGDYTAIFLREGKFNTLSDGVTVYVRSRETNGDLRGIIYHDNRTLNRPITIMAERGTLATTEDGPRVIMINGNRQQIERDTGKLQLLYFERYSVDIDRSEQKEEVSWRKPSERFLHELIWLDDTPADRFHAKILRAEAHNRIVAPLLNLALALLALAAILPGAFDRRGQAKRIVAAVALAVILQSAAIGIHNVITREPLAAPFAYLNVLGVSALALWLLLRQPRRRVQRFAPA